MVFPAPVGAQTSIFSSVVKALLNTLDYTKLSFSTPSNAFYYFIIKAYIYYIINILVPTKAMHFLFQSTRLKVRIIWALEIF